MEILPMIYRERKTAAVARRHWTEHTGRGLYRLLWAWIVLVSLLTVLGCQTPLGTNMERIEPLGHWPGLYLEVVACVGETGPMGFQGIEWYVADTLAIDGVPMAGIWQGRKIMLRRDEITSNVVVKHELIHYVTQRAEHPQALFSLCTIIVPREHFNR